MSAPALQVDNLCAGYDGRPALHNISFTFEAGDCLGLIGPNGAGKTTLLRVLGGALPPASGAVRLQGDDLFRLSRRERSRKISFVPQQLHLPVAFSVLEFTALGRTPHVRGWSRLSRADRAAVEAALEAADLCGLEDRLLDELSGGERQRALVAMALAQEPDILLLDEPTAHLDIQHAWNLMDLIAKLHRERRVGVILSSHDLNLTAEYGTRLLLLDRGEMAALGPASEVMTPERLSRVYAHPLNILRLVDGGLCVRPQRPANTERR